MHLYENTSLAAIQSITIKLKAIYFGSMEEEEGSLERRAPRFLISNGCLLLLLRMAQSSSVSAASYLPWRRYSAPRFWLSEEPVR